MLHVGADGGSFLLHVLAKTVRPAEPGSAQVGLSGEKHQLEAKFCIQDFVFADSGLDADRNLLRLIQPFHNDKG